jgi:transcription elongation factor Elf1
MMEISHEILKGASKRVKLYDKNVITLIRYDAFFKCPNCGKEIEIIDFNPAVKHHRAKCFFCQEDIIIEYEVS